MLKSLVFSLVLAALATACSSGEPSGLDEEIDSTSQPIISGKPSDSSQDAVVLILHQSEGSISGCTGTLVAPNLVLTARHCVSETGRGGFGCDVDGNVVSSGGGDGGKVGDDFKPAELLVFTGETRPVLGDELKPHAIGKKLFHDGADAVCAHDIALLLLDRAIPGATPASIRLDSRARRGEKITAVGWGVTVDTSFPKQRQQRTGIVIKEVGPFKGSSADDPVPDNDFLVGESTCSGDSGGPAFAEDTGAVIGVVSRGGNGKDDSTDPSAGCIDAANEYTQTAPFKSLVLKAFREAGYEPLKEELAKADTKKGCSASPSPVRDGTAAMVAALGIAMVAVRRRRRGCPTDA